MQPNGATSTNRLRNSETSPVDAVGFEAGDAVTSRGTVTKLRQTPAQEYESPEGIPGALLLPSSEKGEHRGFCLYTQQGVRIVCGEDRKDE